MLTSAQDRGATGANAGQPPCRGTKDDNGSTQGCCLSGPPLLKGSHSTRESKGGKVRTTQMMKQKAQTSPESAQVEIRSKMTIHRK